jgi:hypothetical protein
MGISKPHALRSQFVDMRRSNLSALGIVTLDVAIAEVIGIDQNNVGFFL